MFNQLILKEFIALINMDFICAIFIDYRYRCCYIIYGPITLPGWNIMGLGSCKWRN